MRHALMWGCVVGIFAIAVTARLSYPDMSETRLFLEFWPAWLCCTALAACAVWLSRTP